LVWCLLLLFCWPLALAIAAVYIFVVFWREILALIAAVVSIVVAAFMGICALIGLGVRHNREVKSRGGSSTAPVYLTIAVIVVLGVIAAWLGK
jgi:hypothetical protein